MLNEFLIRASYPNYFMVKQYADHGREIFNCNVGDKNNRLEGNKPGTVIYTLDGDPTAHEFPPRWYDMNLLMRLRGEQQRHFLELLLLEHFGPDMREGQRTEEAAPATRNAELEKTRSDFRQQCIDYVQNHPLYNSNELITTLMDGSFDDEQISYKGRMLLDLTRNGYPVPDFCILTADAFLKTGQLENLIEKAIRNLEVMTGYTLGSDHNPLVFAIRCAMPQYIPGLMPTLLNVGITRDAYRGLGARRVGTANRAYLSTLHSISEMLRIERRYDRNDILLTPDEQQQRIESMEQAIIAARADGLRLLCDAHYQTLCLVKYVRQFYLDNQDLILTFMQGKQAYPSLILQRMVWTIGNEESYPGVLYSYHSRTGQGRQFESYRNIFGEEIMTGDVTSTDIAYSSRVEIKHDYPAVFHFDPLLDLLEQRYKSPVTIEFAVETRPRRISLFAVLQLNMSEMTGRAALISAIDLLDRGLVSEHDVMSLIKPYHLRQIVSNSIDDRSMARLDYFGRGLSVLPRTAITATLCFSAARAQELKRNGHSVCLCQERFVPEDTITLGELDAILSMSPAAIHVVTACRGYGIPALMDLQSYGIRMDGNSLINADGMTIKELDSITISSKHQTIYKGVADFKPARFTKFINGETVKLEPDEVRFFNEMKYAYQRYQDIVTSEKASFITDVNKLARLIRCDLQDKSDIARDIVNNWYTDNADLYVRQVLESKMGDHLDQSRVFNFLTAGRKVDFFKKATEICLHEHLSGLKAGSFMLGRFVANPLPTDLWNQLNDQTVAFLLNEYVLYEKYLSVLEEVGEIKLARAHSKIEAEGIDSTTIDNFDLYNFIPLLHSSHDWQNVAASLEEIEHQDNTHLLVEKLSLPVDKIFDLTKPWIAEKVAQNLS